jgi:hypothetical protein
VVKGKVSAALGLPLLLIEQDAHRGRVQIIELAAAYGPDEGRDGSGLISPVIANVAAMAL